MATNATYVVETRASVSGAYLLSGAEELDLPWLDLSIKPANLEIVYRFGPGHHRGWWVATSVSVSGPIVRGRGKDLRSATREFSNEGRDVQVSNGNRVENPMPEWLDRMVSELRPSGQVYLAGEFENLG